jgi:hypothetical protein
VSRYDVAAVFMVLLTVFTFAASYLGWGLTSDAEARARNVRQGSIHGRRFLGGGPGFGK